MPNRKMMKSAARLLSNPESIQSDMIESIRLAQQHLSEKYLSKMMRAVEECRRNADSQPLPHIKLLNAAKPFASQESHDRIDRMIDMLQMYATMSEMHSSILEALPQEESRQMKAASVSSSSAQVVDTSVHPDGIYDVDSNCKIGGKILPAAPAKSNMLGMLMAMSLLKARR